MPKIIYLDRRLAAEYGAGPKDVSEHYAKMLKGKGLAKLVNTPPIFNPKIKPEPIVERDIEKIPAQPKEDLSLLTHIVWIESKPSDQEVLDVGRKCGFHIYYARGTPIDIERLLLSDLAIINPSRLDYPTSFLYMMKILLFQKQVQFALKIDDEPQIGIFHWQLVARSRVNLFVSNKLKRVYENRFGHLIEPWRIDKGAFCFWRDISDHVP